MEWFESMRSSEIKISVKPVRLHERQNDVGFTVQNLLKPHLVAAVSAFYRFELIGQTAN